MTNFIIDKETCRRIVRSGTNAKNKVGFNYKRNETYSGPQIIQVEIVITGSATSQNPTWHKEDGWSKRRWAYAYILDEDGKPNINRLVKVYSTMTVEDDWTNTDNIGGLESANMKQFTCFLIYGRWHILAPMMLASATLRVEFAGLWK